MDGTQMDGTIQSGRENEARPPAGGEGTNLVPRDSVLSSQPTGPSTILKMPREGDVLPNKRSWRHSGRPTCEPGPRTLFLTTMLFAFLLVPPLLWLFYKSDKPEPITPTDQPDFTDQITPTPNHTRTKRSTSSPCLMNGGKNTYQFGTAVCVVEGRSAIIQLYINQYLPGYEDYEIYFTVPFDRSWAGVVATTGGWTPTGGSSLVQQYRHVIKATKRAGLITLTVNAAYKVSWPGDTRYQQNCIMMDVWAWARGKDPRSNHNITICIYKNTRVANRPIVTPEVARTAVGTSIVVLDSKVFDDLPFQLETGVSRYSNSWLQAAESTAHTAHLNQSCVVCSVASPALLLTSTILETSAVSKGTVIPSNHSNIHCMLQMMSQDNLDSNCNPYDTVYPVAPREVDPPMFLAHLMVNLTCYERLPTKVKNPAPLGNISINRCTTIVKLTGSASASTILTARADVWWFCGRRTLYNYLHPRWSGRCGLVSLVYAATVIPMEAENLDAIHIKLAKKNGRVKREVIADAIGTDSPVYIDAIGIPRGVPKEYKLVNSIAAGFESLPIISAIFPVTPIKNADRINYIHYNMQRVANFTRDSFFAIHSQLSAASLMATQNRMAVDMLMLEKGGVCALFGDECCTFIPNNTAPDGSLTRALKGLRALSNEMKEHSGIYKYPLEDWFDSYFGEWSAWAKSIMLSIACFCAILVVCSCCCIPCIRGLCSQWVTTMITTQIDTPQCRYQMVQRVPPPEDDPLDDKYDNIIFKRVTARDSVVKRGIE